MIRRPPVFTRNDPPVPYTTLCRSPADPQETGSLFFAAAINAARQRVWLSTPYFVPDHAVRAALQLAVLRGVDVRVLIPARPDHHTVRSDEHTSELMSLMRISYAVFCLNKNRITLISHHV